MNVEKIFHMTGGHGDTSYARNSSVQKKGSDMMKNLTTDAILDMYGTLSPASIGMADLGCSSGPNTLAIVRKFIDTIEKESGKKGSSKQEIRIYLNDLPSNDFNSIFKSLPEFYEEMEKDYGASGRSSVFITGCPGSFYSRLFPYKSIHFVYSSYCLHWLSKVPPGLYDEQGKSRNKASVGITTASPPDVSMSYMEQFKVDFLLFLGLRSEEVLAGGRMVVILLTREGPDHIDRGNSFLWEVLTRSFAKLASEGKIEPEKIDEYDLHFYAPSKEEITDQVIQQGDFELEKFEMFDAAANGETNGTVLSYGQRVSAGIRAVQESMIAQHFGEEILDDLFEIYAKFLDDEAKVEKISPLTSCLVLRKK